MAIFQAVGHVVSHAHMREHRVILEHHAHVALIGGDAVYHLAVHADFARFDGVKADNHAQQRGFAAAGGAQQRKKLAGLNLGGQALNDNIFPICLGYVIYLNGNAHRAIPRFKNREASRQARGFPADLIFGFRRNAIP